MNDTDHVRGPLRAGLDLHPAPDTVAAARSFVRRTLNAWDCQDPEDVVVLLTSEVVTNAVIHASTAIRLELSLAEDRTLLVETTDRHPGLPVVQPADLLREHGRGMLLVERLADRWGVDRNEDDRKVVWFEVPISNAPGNDEQWPVAIQAPIQAL